VTNTHIHYNNRRGDLKLGQLQMLCQAIPSFCHRFLASLDPRRQSTIEMPSGVGLVLCGDFNATPNSALMDFIWKRRLHSTQHCRKKADGLTANSVPRLASPSSPQPNADSDSEQGAIDPATALNAMAFHPTDTTEFVHHSLPLASVYGPNFEDGQQRVTQYHAEHRLMCDYIMFTPHQLQPTGFLELPTPSQLGRRLMPNEVEPSDHFLLKAEFDWLL
jgi:mRNA deadenylase 3'-5' endonuclease subunit Ccr4